MRLPALYIFFLIIGLSWSLYGPAWINEYHTPDQARLNTSVDGSCNSRQDFRELTIEANSNSHPGVSPRVPAAVGFRLSARFQNNPVFRPVIPGTDTKSMSFSDINRKYLKNTPPAFLHANREYYVVALRHLII